MMGVTHATSGLLAGIVVAPYVGVHGTAEQLVFAIVMAGYVGVPDLDHASSSCSRIFGWATNVLSFGVRKLSFVVYQVTKGPADEDTRGEHRHLTHCAVFAGLLGWLATWGGDQGPWWVFGIIVLGVVFAADRLGDLALLVAAGAGIVWWTTQPAGTVPTTLAHLSGTVGIAVALGCLTHDLGDMLTEHGVPLLWPLPIRGETWYEIRPPALIRFRTGGPGETLVLVLLVVAIGWRGWQLVAPHLHPHPQAFPVNAREVIATRM